MTLSSQQELERLKRIGRIVGLTIAEMQKHVQPGITTAELDDIGAQVLAKHGARSAPQLLYDFPGVTCISVNYEAAHGIPGERVIADGDLVNVDVSAELDGYFADSGATVPVPPVSPAVQMLCDCTREALDSAMSAARAGRPLNVIGRAVEARAKRCELSIIRNLTGHGIGRHLHEEPHAVLNYSHRGDSRRLTDGLVLTIEPFFSFGADHAIEDDDGWTLRTADGSLMAQYEHTVVITKRKPIVLTAVE